MPDANVLRYPAVLTNAEWKKKVGKFSALVKGADELGKVMDALESTADGLGHWLYEFEEKLENAERSKNLDESPSPIFFEKMKRTHYGDFEKAAGKLQKTALDVQKVCKDSKIVPSSVTAYVSTIMKEADIYGKTLKDRINKSEAGIKSNEAKKGVLKKEDGAAKINNALLDKSNAAKLAVFTKKCEEFAKQFDAAPSFDSLFEKVDGLLSEGDNALAIRLKKAREERPDDPMAWKEACEKECLSPAGDVLNNAEKKSTQLKASDDALQKDLPGIKKILGTPQGLETQAASCNKALKPYEEKREELVGIPEDIKAYRDSIGGLKKTLDERSKSYKEQADRNRDYLADTFGDYGMLKSINENIAEWATKRKSLTDNKVDISKLTGLTKALEGLAEQAKGISTYSSNYKKSPTDSNRKGYEDTVKKFDVGLDTAAKLGATYEKSLRDSLQQMMDKAPRHPVDKDFYREDLDRFKQVESAADWIRRLIQGFELAKKNVKDFERLFAKTK